MHSFYVHAQNDTQARVAVEMILMSLQGSKLSGVRKPTDCVIAYLSHQNAIVTATCENIGIFGKSSEIKFSDLGAHLAKAEKDNLPPAEKRHQVSERVKEHIQREEHYQSIRQKFKEVIPELEREMEEQRKEDDIKGIFNAFQ